MFPQTRELFLISDCFYFKLAAPSISMTSLRSFILNSSATMSSKCPLLVTPFPDWIRLDPTRSLFPVWRCRRNLRRCRSNADFNRFLSLLGFKRASRLVFGPPRLAAISFGISPRKLAAYCILHAAYCAARKMYGTRVALHIRNGI